MLEMKKSNSTKRSLQTKLFGGTVPVKKSKIEEYVACPICEIEVTSTLIQLHVDSCLQKTEQSPVKCEKGPVASSQSDINVQRWIHVKSDGAQMPNDVRLVEVHDVPGLWLIYDFISEEEEESIVNFLDSDITPWHFSKFNGNCNSKSFGVKTQFGAPGEERCVRRNNPALGEFDIPQYLEPFPLRLQYIIQQVLNDHDSNKSRCDSEKPEKHTLGLLYQKSSVPPREVVSFVPNECNANSYESKANHYLRPHFDDRILSGPILMNMSLMCDSKMTYHLATNKQNDSNEIEYSVLLPRRTLQLVTGPARWKYRHSIKAEDVLGQRRVSITWRRSESKIAGMRHKAESANDKRVSNSQNL